MFTLKNTIAECVNAFLTENGGEAMDIQGLLETPADIKNGDISLPCFRFSKALRKAPPMIAAALKEKLEGAIPQVEKIDAAGGYLNFYLSPAFYTEALKGIASANDFGSSDIGKGKTVCLDFSSPNIAKRFHVGQLGTTAIGGCLKNLYDFCGYTTVGINHLGDWGTQFGKLIVAYKKWSSFERVKERGISELVDIYVRFSAEAEKDDSLNDEARAAFAKLESLDEEYISIWQSFKEISLKEYMKTYELLGIEFDSYNGESFYNDKMEAIVEELREKNLLVVDDGASIVRLDDYDMPPAIILKKDGSTLYATRDITAAVWRKNNYDFYKCIYVTSAGQSLHFAQYFKVLELMGYDWSKDLVHVPYGTMSVNGEKLASRTGNVILLDDLFAEAIAKAEKIIEEKNSDLKDKHGTAVAVGVGAIVFGALSNGRIKDTNFVWEEALSFEGNTGPYVQYTYARAASILRKAEGEQGGFDGYTPQSEEIALTKLLCTFPDKVLLALSDHEPCVIARYALDLCAAYNLFYHNCTILKAEGEAKAFRLQLTAIVKHVLGKCLDLLGMKRTEEI